MSQADRRRAHRVQGSFNSSANKKKSTSPKVINSSVDHASSSVKRCPEFECSTSTAPPSSSQPCWIDKNIDGYNAISKSLQQNLAQKEFKFDSGVAEDVQLEENSELRRQTIEETGVYQLSKSPNGLPARVVFVKQFIPTDEANSLFDRLHHELPWRVRQGVNRSGSKYDEPRQTCWFGLPYTYSHVAWQANSEWPELLQDLRVLITNRQGTEFNSVMCNLYRDNHDKIGWHADDEPSLGKNPVIASLSFGCTRRFMLKPKDGYFSNKSDTLADEITMMLGHGDLLIMYGSLQDSWMHSVPSEYHDKEPRINLTFRVIVNSPNERLTIETNSNCSYTLSESFGQQPAKVYFSKKCLPSNLIQLVSRYLYAHQRWDSNAEDSALKCRHLKFSIDADWPERLNNLGVEVARVCSTANSGISPVFTHIQALLLQGSTQFYPWQKSEVGSDVAVLAIGNDNVQRPFVMRKKASSSAKGDYIFVEILLGSCDVFLMTGSFFDNWDFQIPPCETLGGKGVIFVIFRTSLLEEGDLSGQMSAANISRTSGDTLWSSCDHMCKNCNNCISSVDVYSGGINDVLCPLCQCEATRSIALNSSSMSRRS